MTTETIILNVVLLVSGLGAGFTFAMMKAKGEAKKYEAEGEEIINKANEKAEKVRRNAKQEAKQIIAEEREKLEEDYSKREKKISQTEKELTRKEVSLDAKIENKERELENIKKQEQELYKKQARNEEEFKKLQAKHEEITEKLTQVSGLTKEQAKAEIIELMTEEAKVDAAKMIARIEEDANEEAEAKSKRILGIAMQRFAGEYVAEQTITSVELPDDGIKGRLIGREGRNIRAFEQICGVDLIIDDTPGVVTISSFNVVRKQIARMSIERLIADGRIHPAKIEEFYEKSKAEFDSKLRDLGEKAQMEIGIHGLHPEVLKMIGALNWRTSYMQNQYQHSLEVAFLCGNLAAELGLNVKQARRAGLLHDIGKVMDASQEGSHAMVGADFLKKYGESPDVIHAVRAHHEDVKPETVLSHLVIAADALSASRPGVRKFLKESYVSRLSDIENIVNSFDGVSKSYAISAGREIRVLVENEKIDDEKTVMLSRDIAKKIEQEMSYPGSIKVSVIRETRAIGIAK
jgi:ribonuclease Y